MSLQNNLFDQISTNYLKYRAPKKLVLKRIHQLLEKHQKADGKLLDLGCGVGNYLDALDNHCGFNRYGLDSSIAMLTANSVIRNRAFLVQGDFCKVLPFRTESFQVVFAIDVLHFVNSIPSLLSEIRRILLPGGVFIAVLHTPEDIRIQTLSQYFPETTKLELPQAKKLLRLKSCALNKEFVLLSKYQDIERIKASKAFLKLFEHKCASALHEISPAEYLKGVRKLRLDFTRKKLIGAESHTTYVFRRT